MEKSKIFWLYPDEWFGVCTNKCHSKFGSKYPKHRVPLFKFDTTRAGGTSLKNCLECRAYQRAAGKKKMIRKRERDENVDKTVPYPCKQCNQLRVKSHPCTSCQKINLIKVQQRRNDHERVQLECLREQGYACSLCKKISIKCMNGKKGVNMVDSFDGDEDKLELRNLELDHLDKEEQLKRFGEYRGPKIKKVSNFQSYGAKKKKR
jgi:hypothetical protein